MPKPGAIKRLAQQIDLQATIPALVEQLGSQRKVAQQLGIGQATISRWLKANGYTRSIQLIRRSKP